jgi:hypothetical protein
VIITNLFADSHVGSTHKLVARSFEQRQLREADTASSITHKALRMTRTQVDLA